ncbi:MAG: hypothetical protein K8I02_01135 [Candidatus Methylomirabilis sp.]|nr:hypothetical protein [Deltaproteobacteria bacterium]
MVIEVRADRGTKALLLSIAVLLAANLAGPTLLAWFAPRAALAQFKLDAGAQRAQMIEELKGLRADVSALRTALTAKPLPVAVVKPSARE